MFSSFWLTKYKVFRYLSFDSSLYRWRFCAMAKFDFWCIPSDKQTREMDTTLKVSVTNHKCGISISSRFSTRFFGNYSNGYTHYERIHLLLDYIDLIEIRIWLISVIGLWYFRGKNNLASCSIQQIDDFETNWNSS